MADLRVERDGSVLRVTLARPDRRNAFDAELIAALRDAFADVGDARAVVLSGEGESFCAGADVEWMRSSVELSYEENVQDARRLRQMLETRRVRRASRRPHARTCARGRLRPRCRSDVVLAAEGTEFAFSEVKLGIIPAAISPFALAKIGASAARRYFVTGERFDGEVALRIGLVHEVVADLDDAEERVLKELLERRAGRGASRVAAGALTRRRARDGTADRRAADEAL